jgi:dolichol-phosphate mannosyltransferase
MLSVVVPICNEAAVLDAFHERTRAAIAALGPYELIFVDDGSTDGSWERMLSLAARDPSVRLIRLSRNFGHQIALTAGLDATRGDAIVFIDADLQDPPELIPSLVAKWRAGFDVVYGVRTDRPGETPFKRATASLFYKGLRRLTGTPIAENAGDFRLLSRRAADAVSQMPERARFLRGMTGWIGYRQTGVEYRRDPRFAGETKYPPRRMARFALDAITSFSTTPVRIVTLLGLATVVFCGGYLCYTLYVRFFTTTAVPGWTTVVVLVLLLGGVQLVSLGIIGEYVARIFEEAKARPLYLVDEVVEGGALAQERVVSTPAHSGLS